MPAATPTGAPSPSIRIPAIFRPPHHRSVGHLRANPEGSAGAAATGASWGARGATRGSSPRVTGKGVGATSSEYASKQRFCGSARGFDEGPRIDEEQDHEKPGHRHHGP